MKTEKTLETRKDIDCLKFHTKTWLGHLEAIEGYHKDGKEVGFDKEKPAINAFWFNEHYRKGIVEFFDLYEELEKSNLWLQKELKEEAETHLGFARIAGEITKVSYEKKIENLKEELDINKATLLNFVELLAKEKVQNSKLLDTIFEQGQALKSTNKELAEVKTQLHLSNKPLPLINKPLPRKPSRIKEIGLKIKTKFQQLVRREKQQKQELVARVEIPTK